MKYFCFLFLCIFCSSISYGMNRVSDNVERVKKFHDSVNAFSIRLESNDAKKYLLTFSESNTLTEEDLILGLALLVEKERGPTLFGKRHVTNAIKICNNSENVNKFSTNIKSYLRDLKLLNKSKAKENYLNNNASKNIINKLTKDQYIEVDSSFDVVVFKLTNSAREYAKKKGIENIIDKLWNKKNEKKLIEPLIINNIITVNNYIFTCDENRKINNRKRVSNYSATFPNRRGFSRNEVEAAWTLATINQSQNPCEEN